MGLTGPKLISLFADIERCAADESGMLHVTAQAMMPLLDRCWTRFVAAIRGLDLDSRRPCGQQLLDQYRAVSSWTDVKETYVGERGFSSMEDMRAILDVQVAITEIMHSFVDDATAALQSEIMSVKQEPVNIVSVREVVEDVVNTGAYDLIQMLANAETNHRLCRCWAAAARDAKKAYNDGVKGIRLDVQEHGAQVILIHFKTARTWAVVERAYTVLRLAIQEWDPSSSSVPSSKVVECMAIRRAVNEAMDAIKPAVVDGFCSALPQV